MSNVLRRAGIAQFEKVSYEEFKHAYIKTFHSFNENELRNLYDNIKLPKRATPGSAGYDFFSPFTKILIPGESIVIPTGIRCHFYSSDFSLDLYPRSGLGFKHRLSIANTVGIIDSDYYFSDNEGHIQVKLCYDGFDDNKNSLQITQGDRFVQGIFHKYYITVDDDAEGERTGGFGSTGK